VAEAHERSLQTDILFGVVKRAMQARGAVKEVSSITNTQKEKEDLTRDEIILNLMRAKAKEFNLPPLHIVVMSATLDVQTFTEFLPHAKCIKIPGRTFPVQTLYTKDPQEDYIDAALLAALQIHYYEEEGDILIFLPGQEDIETLSLLLKKHLEEKSQLAKELSNQQQQGDVVQSIKGMGTDLNSGHAMIVNGVLICTLYAALPPEAQMFAFAPKPKGCSRKIILSTNIAETSVTLDGIVYVIDSGKFKSREYSAATGMETLTVSNISQAQADQRKGRAGRVSAGLCFRLYPEDAFCKLQETATPEILRVNLAQVVLQLKGMGIHDPRTFDFLTQPSTETLVKAFEQLYALGAVDSAMNLTPYGKKMSKLPLDPTSAHLLLQSPEFKCTAEMLTAVAMLSAENIFYRPGGNEGSIGNLSGKASAAHSRFASHEGDLPTFLFVYNCWKDEAFYMPHKKQKVKNKPMKKIPHGEWCAQNFISGRSLVRAHDVRKQLTEICSRDEKKNGLGMDTTLSCGEEMEDFLKCVCSGLFLQSASRMINSNEINKANRKERKAGNESSVRGRYKTKIGGREVSIHPTSSLFGRNPPPKCVVYTELLETNRSYIRGVTQVKEEWLNQVAPSFFKA
jgi:HrpA-like RNA helicase